MKTFQSHHSAAIACAAMLASMSLVSASNDSFIKQWQLSDDGSRVCVSTIYFAGPNDGSSSSGTKTSEQTVGSAGSYYELWTDGIGSDNSTNYLLDTAYVAPYAPESTITFSSGDPYATARTRADESFWVHVGVKDLMAPDTGAPDSALNVYFQHTALAYDSSTNGAAAGAEEAFIQDAYINDNGTIHLEGASQLANEGVTADDPDGIAYKQRGEDIFRSYAFVRDGTASSGLQIAEGKIQIWPIAEASIYLKDYEPDATLTRSLPDIEVSVTDAYPYSTTYVLIYKGQKDSSGRDSAQVIEAYRRSFPSTTTVPQNLSITIPATNWTAYVPDDGTYTLEVVTHTPFEGLAYPSTSTDTDGNNILDTDHLPTSGGLRLVHNTFTVDRTVQVKGNVISSE
ncbi:hypothetical protein HW115_02275 [Verrucomicrobiaceae bacterium N1E253]|uniref:Uncharacterized protein n=1 Tax=Oceaniferula marina TaxID=2748318 RepID=A0A851GIG9_9BACT|nr:hypothetical protein [Oceaniferula marina]NWK54420.1 hypothetical protein [Oceaniferula marina]